MGQQSYKHQIVNAIWAIASHHLHILYNINSESSFFSCFVAYTKPRNLPYLLNMIYRTGLITLVLLATSITLFSQLPSSPQVRAVSGTKALSQHINLPENDDKTTLAWGEPRTANYTDTYSEMYLYFDGAKYDRQPHQIPVFTNRTKLASNVTGVTATLTNMEFEDFNLNDLNSIKGLKEIREEIAVEA